MIWKPRQIDEEPFREVIQGLQEMAHETTSPPDLHTKVQAHEAYLRAFWERQSVLHEVASPPPRQALSWPFPLGDTLRAPVFAGGLVLGVLLTLPLFPFVASYLAERPRPTPMVHMPPATPGTPPGAPLTVGDSEPELVGFLQRVEGQLTALGAEQAPGDPLPAQAKRLALQESMEARCRELVAAALTTSQAPSATP